VKVHRGDLWADVRNGLKAPHPGKNPTTVWFEGGTLDDADAPTDWCSRTGKSSLKIKWQLEQDTQKFLLWTPNGAIDLGDEVIEGRSQDEVWREVAISDSHLGPGDLNEYRTFLGQSQLRWEDLPIPGMILVPK
jgi:hypothetical protein